MTENINFTTAFFASVPVWKTPKILLPTSNKHWRKYPDFVAVLYTDTTANGEAQPLDPLDVIALEKRMATVKHWR